MSDVEWSPGAGVPAEPAAPSVPSIDLERDPTSGIGVPGVNYEGVVTCLGKEPTIRIRGIGDVRFAYRNVKKRPMEQKPLLAVGDVMQCRLVLSAQTQRPKAIALLLMSSGGGASVRAPVDTAALPVPPATVTGKPLFTLTDDGERVSLANASPNSDSDGSQWSEGRSVSPIPTSGTPLVYSFDPYSQAGVRIVSAGGDGGSFASFASSAAGPFPAAGRTLSAGGDASFSSSTGHYPRHTRSGTVTEQP